MQAITILAVVGLALLVMAAAYILLLVFAGILLAVLLVFFAGQLTRLPAVPHWLAVTMVLVLLLGMLALVVVLVIPLVVEESGQLAEQLEKSIQQLLGWVQENTDGSFPVDDFSAVEEHMPALGDVWSGVTGIFATTMDALTGVAIILVVGVFITYSPTMHTQGVLHLVPLAHRTRAAEVMAVVGLTVRWWLLGQLMPIVFHRMTQIPPALGVVSRILFGSLLGFLGFVLAVPLMAVILQSVKMIYVQDILGDRSLNGDAPTS